MTKTELLNKFAKDPEERVVLARVLDQMDRAANRSIPCATQFLSPAQRAALEPLIAACGRPRCLFHGGYEGAEGTVGVFLPDWQEAEDWDAAEELAAIQCAYPPTGAELTHRDLLGGLMGIGLTREKVGDILAGESAAQIVCMKEAAPIISVSPPRLDAVLASGFSLARAKAADAVTGGRVSVNHRECLKPDRPVEEGDVLTCRGLGKCVLKTVGGQSRKGRIIIEIERYL